MCRKLTNNGNNAKSREVGELCFQHRKIDIFSFYFLKSKCYIRFKAYAFFHNQSKIYTSAIESILNVISGM